MIFLSTSPTATAQQMAPQADHQLQTSSTQRGRPRQRSAVACTWCHSRRVKCNAAAKGPPCSNCETVNRPCTLIESKRGKKRKLSASPPASHQDLIAIAETPRQERPTPHGHVYDPLRESRHVPKESQIIHAQGSSIATVEDEKLDPSREAEETTLYAQVLEKATNAEVAQDVKEGVVHVMYMGETFNLTHLLRQVHAKSDSDNLHRKRHYVVHVVPKNRSSNHPAEDNTVLASFLRQQGAFTVPTLKICYLLFRTYFDFVHPHYPILDRADFATQYANPDNPPSYLLLQSVLFMAAGHCDLAVLQEAGFSSRYQARKAFFQRAKILYDNDHEPNKVTVVQSVFLMSFWWNGLEDHKDTWHWLGISISLALTLGMHRSTRYSDMRPRDKSLWKKIWWSLFIEDKHAATALGRPVHIRHADCDIERLEEADFEEQPVVNPEIFGAPEPVDGLYVIALAELSMIAESIVEKSFTAFNATTSCNADMFQTCSEELAHWKEQLPLELQHEKNSSCLWVGMLHIAHSWFEIVTHRSIKPQDLSPPSMKDAHALAMKAANRLIQIVQDLLGCNHILQCPIHIVPALFAAMGMQAVDIYSGDELQGQLGAVRTKVAMLALQQLQETWPVSGWIFHLFKKIVRRIQDKNEFLPNEPVNSSPLQTKTMCNAGALPVNNVHIEPQALLDGKPPYQDMSLSQLYTMSGHQTGRYVFPNMSTMPMGYTNTDWQSVYEEGSWGDFDYEF